MDLEDELKRLFADERLTVQVPADAEKTVVAGAKRIRRRRTALVSAAGVVAAAAVVTGTLMLTHGPDTAPTIDGGPPLSVTSSVPSSMPSPEPSSSFEPPAISERTTKSAGPPVSRSIDSSKLTPSSKPTSPSTMSSKAPQGPEASLPQSTVNSTRNTQTTH
jgi:hypothetical protein